MALVDKNLDKTCENLAADTCGWISKHAVNDATAHAAIWKMTVLFCEKAMEISRRAGGERLMQKNANFFIGQIQKQIDAK